VGVSISGLNAVGVLAYNKIEGNGVGVEARYAYMATIHHNAFLNNTVQASGGVQKRHWDAGFPEGGNFWSDYVGVDRCTSATQDVCPIPDGFGDSPYVILAGSFGEPVADRYPLIEPPTRPVEEPQAGPDESVPGVLDFLTSLPGAMLLLLAPPAAAAAYMWARVRRGRPPRPPA
jgi:hypothetical protein